MEINDIKIDKITRDKRKNISIKISTDGFVSVCAPQYLSNYELHKVLSEKYDWMKKKKSEVFSKYIKYEHSYKDGEEFFFLGEIFNLKLVDKNIIKLDKNNKKIECYKDCNVGDVIKSFYKKLANHYVLKIAYETSEKTGIYPKQYKISSALKRWGSCSGRKSINLSYRLLLLPRDIIEYVVIHELAHLTEMNHSKKFWDYVEQLLPDYKNKEKWINEQSYKYSL